MSPVNETAQKKTNEQIMKKLSLLVDDKKRDSEHIRNSLQTHIDVLNAHLIEGLEHREIDEIILKYPLNSKGNVITKGSISSRMLYWLGIKGKENRKSIFLGIFSNKNIDELIEMLKEARTSYKEKQKINMVINLFQINKVANNNSSFAGILNAYDQLYMVKVNSISKISEKSRTQDPLLRVLLESRRTLLEEEIDLEMIPTILREMALHVLQIIKIEKIIDFEIEVQELYILLQDEVYINNEDGETSTNLEGKANAKISITKEKLDVDNYNLSIEEKSLIEVEPPFPQRREDVSQRTTHTKRARRAIKRNYEQEQTRNTIVGDVAEKMVLNLEKEKLIAANREDLSKIVEHISVTQGDGLGYDIKSFEKDGTEIFIEVKGSTETANKSFFISESEVGFSREFPEQFYLYRVYDLNSNQPKYFKLKGSLEDHFNLIPTEYLAKIK